MSIDLARTVILEVFQRFEVVNVDLVFKLVLDNRVIAEGEVQTVDGSWILSKTLLEDAVLGFFIV